MQTPFETPRTRNLKTQALYRRDLIWQIALPLTFAILVGLTLSILVGWQATVPSPTVRPLADVSLLLLIMISALIGILMFAVLLGLVAAIWYGLRELPFVFKRAQDLMYLVQGHTETIAGNVTQPVLNVHAILAATQTFGSDLAALFQSWRTK